MFDNLEITKLEWEKKPNSLFWVCKNHPLSQDEAVWVKNYFGNEWYDLYAPGFRGPGNKFYNVEVAMMAAQDYLDKFIRNIVSVRRIGYTLARGTTMTEIAKNAHQTPVAERGDMKIIVVNESDLTYMDEL
tara:strand:- start:1537 stop:1929 length:393 start_codon:yes stop_codon:yes gene_type:complete